MAEWLGLIEMIESLASVDLSSVGVDKIGRVVLDAQALANAAMAFAAAALEHFDRAGAWAEDGSLSAAGWASARTGSPKAAMRAQLRVGRVQRLLPSVASPARRGRLSPEHLGVLAACERHDPVLAARDESLLLGHALELDADAFRVASRHWRDRASDASAPEPQPGPEPTGELHLSQTLDGWWALDGRLSPEDGDLVHAALDAEVDRQLRAQRDGDPSVGLVASQLRAQALVDLLAQTMRRQPGDDSVPDRHRVTVVVPFDRLDEAGAAACDSLLHRVVVGADGEVLDVGRDVRAWPRGIRRAITHRDGGCVFPGCDRPPSWCDVHHLHHWEHGGKTNVDNGALLCRRHHTFIHKQRWRLDIEGGQAVTRRPDGREHVISRWCTG